MKFNLSKIKTEESYEDCFESLEPERFSKSQSERVSTKSYLFQSAKATSYFTTQLPIPRQEIFPGRHLLREKSIREPLVDKLRAVAFSNIGAHPPPDEKILSEESVDIKCEASWPEASDDVYDVRIEALKQYPDQEKQILRAWGHTQPPAKVRYIRHRWSMKAERLLIIQGRKRRRKLRRNWVIAFDELERQLNRLVYGKSLLHPAMGHLNFDNLSGVVDQAWTDYYACDFSDFFTMARLLTFLSKLQCGAIPRYVIVHDYVQYKTILPPGLAGTFDLILEESSDSNSKD